MKTSIGETSCVLIQFSFPDDEIVPDGLNWVKGESLSERLERKGQTTGFIILEKQKKVCISPFMDDLKNEGFQMVSATVKNRVTKQEKSYNVARFIFRSVFVMSRFDRNYAENLFHPKSEPSRALDELAKGYFWRVRAFSNPSKESETTKREFFWSINPEVCSAPKNKFPLYYLTLPKGGSPTYIPSDQFITRR
jgi:hypothetical protein